MKILDFDPENGFFGRKKLLHAIFIFQHMGYKTCFPPSYREKGKADKSCLIERMHLRVRGSGNQSCTP